jgi:hypothetical protein
MIVTTKDGLLCAAVAYHHHVSVSLLCGTSTVTPATSRGTVCAQSGPCTVMQQRCVCSRASIYAAQPGVVTDKRRYCATGGVAYTCYRNTTCLCISLVKEQRRSCTTGGAARRHCTQNAWSKGCQHGGRVAVPRLKKGHYMSAHCGTRTRATPLFKSICLWLHAAHVHHG